MKTRLTQTLYLLLGLLFVILGAIGVLLPLLPTTPFMILALALFARSSPRFHDWLYHHRLFGPPLQAWEQNGSVSPQVKGVAILFMTISFFTMASLQSVTLPMLLVAGGLMLYGGWFLLNRPNPPE